MNIEDPKSIAPALETLRAFPDALATAAVAIHDAMSAVEAYDKPATVTLKLTIEPFKGKSNAPLVNAPVLMSLDVEKKLPKAEAPTQVMYADEDGNPSRVPTTRQRDLGLGVNIK